jgi:hypothetical protein
MKVVVGGLLAGLLLAHLFITPRLLAKKIKGFLSARLPGVQGLQVDVRGPRGVRALKGNFHSLVIQGRGSNVTPLAEELLVAMTKVRYRNGYGRVQEVTARASQFIYDDVEIEQASVTFQDLSFNTRKMVERRRVADLSFERGSAVASLSPSSVSQLGIPILTKKGITNATIHLRDGYVEVSGNRKSPLGAIVLQATGKLIGKANELHVTDLQVKVGSTLLPEVTVKSLAQDLNPLVIFDEKQRFTFNINIHHVVVTPSGVTAEAELTYKEIRRSRGE